MKRFLNLIFLLFFLLGSGQIFAKKQGQAVADSLAHELIKQKEDTNKVKLLNSLSHSYWLINPDEGIKYGQLSLDLAMKLGWEKGIAECYNILGVNYLYKSDYPKALDYYLKALKLDEQLGNKRGIAGVTCNIGIIYNRLSDYSKALDYYFKALKMDQEIGDKQFIANVTGNIGIIYKHLGDDSNALAYYFKALKVHDEIGDTVGGENVIRNIGAIYYSQKDYSRALEYYFNALRIDEQMGLTHNIAIATENIGDVYTVQKNYTMAINYLTRSLKMQEKTGDKSGIAWNMVSIGITYIHIAEDASDKSAKTIGGNELSVNKFEPTAAIPLSKSAQIRLAVDYLQQGLAIGKEINDPALMQGAYEHLAAAYKLSGDYKKALEYEDNCLAIKDSLFSDRNSKKIMEITIKNEIEVQHLADSLKADAKEKIATLQLRRQRSYTYMGIAGAALLLFFLFFMLRNNKMLVKEKQKVEYERQKADDLLLNILPSEVAGELKATGSTTARYYNNVTVLFTDFVNFTKVGESMKPEALIDELHNCFKAFDEITGKYSIEKIKTIGDAYLAVAGLPAANPQHAEHIVKAAIDINNFMRDRQAKLGSKTFEVRIGIHSGDVVAGIVGVKKFAYDIWGDTVNTAARMEQSSEPGKINISETTYELVKDKFACVYRGEIEAKNKGKMKMFYVA